MSRFLTVLPLCILLREAFVYGKIWPSYRKSCLFCFRPIRAGWFTRCISQKSSNTQTLIIRKGINNIMLYVITNFKYCVFLFTVFPPKVILIQKNYSISVVFLQLWMSKSKILHKIKIPSNEWCIIEVPANNILSQTRGVRCKQPVYCIGDDVTTSHTQSSLSALYPIEAAYFHQSQLKGY